jgi:DNA-binding IclR family transcriptional regulator
VRALFPDRAAFADRTGVGPRSLHELRQVLAEVRRRGHADEDGEVSAGFAAVAVAAHDHTGHPVAGVAVTFRARDVVPEQRDRLVGAVVATARELEQRVGGHANQYK